MVQRYSFTISYSYRPAKSYDSHISLKETLPIIGEIWGLLLELKFPTQFPDVTIFTGQW